MKRVLSLAVIVLLFSCFKGEIIQPENTVATPTENSINLVPITVYISSVITTPTLKESITLTNNSGFIADIGGWTLGDKNNPVAYVVPANKTIEIGGTLTFSHTTLGFQINDRDEILYLKNTKGTSN